MKDTETTFRRIAEKMGVLTFLAWTLILGLAGFLLLCALAYAMVADNFALGVACALLLIAPSVFGLVWMLTTGASLLAERRAEDAARPQEAALTHETSHQQQLLAHGQHSSAQEA